MSFNRNSVIVVAILILAMTFIANAQPANEGAKHADYIEVVSKVISIDPIKGDVTMRLEFLPFGKFAKEDSSLTKNIKFDTVSSNGKQEITFEKGKRMSPTEVVLNMYDGDVSDYPFDAHKANLVFFFTVKPDKPAEKPKQPPAEEQTEGAEKPAEAVEEDEVDVPFTLDFATQLPAGYTITTAKSKDSDDTFIDLELSIVRSGMTKFFSVFVMLLMWGLTLAVVGLAVSVVFRDRKIELAMFSFIATLLFAFVAVRNSQPSVPPIGINTDFLSFFLAEIVLAICLLTIVVTWIIKPPK